jgi:hypothetical protein
MSDFVADRFTPEEVAKSKRDLLLLALFAACGIPTLLWCALLIWASARLISIW